MSPAQHGPAHLFVIEGVEALLLARVTQLSPLARRLLLMVGDGLLDRELKKQIDDGFAKISTELESAREQCKRSLEVFDKVTDERQKGIDEQKKPAVGSASSAAT